MDPIVAFFGTFCCALSFFGALALSVPLRRRRRIKAQRASYANVIDINSRRS